MNPIQMLRGILCGIVFASSLVPVTAPGQSPTPVPLAPLLSASQLEELLGPVALYPDVLVAILLPAATVPTDIVLGARYLESGGDAASVDNRPWDDSVKSLVRYPDVLQWMNDNLEWTTAVGEAFISQPDDVMLAIQRLRVAAKDAGNLKNSPQQVVVVEKEVVRIVPAEPDVIYVPQYDPQVVFVQSYSPAPLITFGVGFAIGSWLNWDCDWNRRWIYRGDWCGWNNNWWNRGGSWGGNNNNWNSNDVFVAPQININNTNQNVNVTNIVAGTATRWQPDSRSERQFQQRIQNQTGNARFAASREGRPGAGRPGVPRASDVRENAGVRPLPRPSLARERNERMRSGEQGAVASANGSATRRPTSARPQVERPGTGVGEPVRPGKRPVVTRPSTNPPSNIPGGGEQGDAVTRQEGQTPGRFSPTRPPRVDAQQNRPQANRPQRPSQAPVVERPRQSTPQQQAQRPTRPNARPQAQAPDRVEPPVQRPQRPSQAPSVERPRQAAPQAQVQRPARPNVSRPQSEAPARVEAPQRPQPVERPSRPSRQVEQPAPRVRQQAEPRPARPERTQAQPERKVLAQKPSRPQRVEAPAARPNRPAAPSRPAKPQQLQRSSALAPGAARLDSRQQQ